MPNNQPVSKPTSDPTKGTSHKPPTPRRGPVPGQRFSRDELSRHEREVRARKLLYTGMGMLFVVIAAILGFGWWREYVARASDPAAIVEGKPITLQTYARMLDFRQKGLEQQMQYMEAELQSLGSGSANRSTANLIQQQIQQIQFSLALLPDQTLNDLIDQQLVRQEATRRGITVSAADIDNEINKAFGDHPAPTPAAAATSAPTSTPQATAQPAAGAAPAAATPAYGTATPSAAAATPVAPTPSSNATPAPTADVKSRVNSYLSAMGITDAEFRSMVENQLLHQKLSDAMAAQVPTSAEQIHARHILVDTEAKAKEIEDKLKAGGDFAQLAKTDSQDTTTKDKGGDLGWFPQGKMSPQFDDVAFKLQVNQISQPVKTNTGYEIIQVLEKDPNRPLDPQELAQRKSNALPQWLQSADSAPDIQRTLTDADKNWVYKQINWSPPA